MARNGMRMAAALAALAAAAAGSAAGAAGWAIADSAKARDGARSSVLVAITEVAQPRGSFGRCRIDMVALGTERGRGPLPGSALGAFVPCASRLARREGRWTEMADLGPRRLARLYLARDGEPRDLELLDGRTGPVEASAREADRGQLWRLLDVNKQEALLVDTADVASEGDRRTAWVKRSLGERRVRIVVQVVTRVEYDCAARTQTLHTWYARTGEHTVDSQGTIPAEARRPVPVVAGTAAAIAMAALCSPRRRLQGS